MNNKSKMKYNKDIYKNIDIGHLILFGLYLISQKGNNATFERLVAECFLQFPDVFAFKRYPDWPDSLKYDRPLRTLREKGLIVGTIKDRFSLTEFGRKIAIETENILQKVEIPLKKRKKAFVGRSADDKIVDYLKSSDSFRAFSRNPDNFSISEVEFRNLLRCTSETPKRILKQNLQYSKKLSQLYNEGKLLDFLLFCENKFLGGKNG